MPYQFLYSQTVLHLSRIDSLQRSINAMQVKIDSLEKVVLKTEIGASFFSNVISTNLYMFATIIGLAALISWGFISGILVIHKNRVDKHIASKILEQDQKTEEIKEKLIATVFDANRAMFHIAYSRKIPAAAFKWALSASESLVYFKKIDLQMLRMWLSAAQKQLDQIENGSQIIAENLPKTIAHLDILKNVDNEECSILVESLRKKIYLVAYTPQQPPADIMK